MLIKNIFHYITELDDSNRQSGVCANPSSKFSYRLHRFTTNSTLGTMHMFRFHDYD